MISGDRSRDSRPSPDRSGRTRQRSEEHTSELQSHLNLVCRLLLEKKTAFSTMAAWPLRFHPSSDVISLYLRPAPASALTSRRCCSSAQLPSSAHTSLPHHHSDRL